MSSRFVDKQMVRARVRHEAATHPCEDNLFRRLLVGPVVAVSLVKPSKPAHEEKFALLSVPNCNARDACRDSGACSEQRQFGAVASRRHLGSKANTGRSSGAPSHQPVAASRQRKRTAATRGGYWRAANV